MPRQRRSGKPLAGRFVAALLAAAILTGVGQAADRMTPRDGRSVVVVLDQSNSMETNDSKRLSIEGAEVLLALLPASSSFAVAHFSNIAEIKTPLQFIGTHEDRMRIHAQLSTYFDQDLDELFGGFTSYNSALRAVRQILSVAEKNATVVFLTDGEQQEPPREALEQENLPSDYKLPGEWRPEVIALTKSGARFVAIDINPRSLDKRKPEGVKSLEFMAQQGDGHVFRLQPPGHSKADSAKLLEAFLFIAGETGNLFRTQSRTQIGVFPGAETLLLLAEDAPFSRVARNDKEVNLDDTRSIYRYSSKYNPIDVLNISSPEPGTWQFETDENGRIAFVLADPQLLADFTIEPERTQYVGGLPVKARIRVTPRRTGKSITAAMAQCLSGVVSVISAVGSGVDANQPELGLTRVAVSEEQVVFEADVTLPTVPAQSAETLVTLDGITRLTFDNNAPWELTRRRQLQVVPPTGTLSVAMHEQTSRTGITRAVLAGSAKLRLPVGCEVDFQLRPAPETPKAVSIMIKGKDLNRGVFTANSEELTDIPFECVFECDKQFFGKASATLHVSCRQGGVEPAQTPLSVDFVRARIDSQAVNEVTPGRAKTFAGPVGTLTNGSMVPLDVNLKWAPEGQWPANAKLQETSFTLTGVEGMKSIVLETEKWPALSQRGRWTGKVLAHYGREQVAEVPVEFQMGPLLSCKPPKPIANEPGGEEYTLFRVSHASDSPIDLVLTVGMFRGDGGAKGKILDPGQNRVGIALGDANENYVLSDPQKPFRATVKPGEVLLVRLRFDLKPREPEGKDLVDFVVPGKYSGKIILQPLGASEKERLEVPVSLILGD